jgi:uncharacterized protein YjcR
MQKNDGRKIVGAAIEEHREKAIKLYQSGECKTYKKIAATLRIHRNTISEWIRK